MNFVNLSMMHKSHFIEYSHCFLQENSFCLPEISNKENSFGLPEISNKENSFCLPELSNKENSFCLPEFSNKEKFFDTSFKSLLTIYVFLCS